jgi:hypothetical protein
MPFSTFPAGLLPGQRAIHGTRKPPSRMVPFPPANGVWPPSGQVKFSDDKIAVEVWDLPVSSQTRTQRIVEISFKAREYDQEAIAKRKKLLALLKDKGWLLEKDQLKTERIIESSAPLSGSVCSWNWLAPRAIYRAAFLTTVLLRSAQGLWAWPL